MLRIGTSYYPEHFPEDEWARDLDNMRALGLDCVRVGEFAWSRLEPVEGCYDFAWLERFIEMARKKGLDIIACTPSAAPPRWLCQRYPEILPVDQHGHPLLPGGRKHYCHSSRKYRELVAALVERLAAALSGYDNLLLWQIDNELSSSNSYSADADSRFRQWLQEKYDSLDQLNRAWGTFFWGNDFSDWEQVALPRPPLGGKAAIPKAILLDMKRFRSDEIIGFVQSQTEILRRICPGVPITTNWSPIFDYGFDFHKLAGLLDFPAWDHYCPDARAAAFCHDFVFSCNPRNTGFWVMEQQCAPPDSGSCNSWPPVGWLTAAGRQNILHGARGIVFFHWREFPYGAEVEHGAIVRLNGDTDTMVYREIKEAIPQWREAAANLADHTRQPEVGILFDMENWWSLQPGGSFKVKRRTQAVDYRALLRAWHQSLRKDGLDVVFHTPASDWSPLRVLVIPSLPMISEELQDRLTKFVESGGLLVVGPQTGIWDASANPTGQHALAGLSGLKFLELDCFDPDQEIAVAGESFQAAGMWLGESASPLKNTQTIAVFGASTGILEGKAAIAARSTGRGKVITLNTHPTKEMLEPIRQHWIEPALERPTHASDAAPLRFRWANKDGAFEIEL